MKFYCNGKKDFCDCAILCADCKYFDNSYGKKVQTNADRIRAMTDEQLSEFLWGFDVEEIAREGECFLTKRKITEWLQQPAEDL